MPFNLCSVLFVLLLVSCATEARAQKLSPVVTASVGVSDQGAARPRPAHPSVELQLSQVFYTNAEMQLAMSAGVFWGY